MERKITRKGITAIMSTLLLISFAVAVGVVVMSLGKAQIEGEAVCPVNIGLLFANIGGEEQYCYDGSELRFTVENGININVEGLLVNIIGTERAETFQLDAKMGKAGSHVGKVPYIQATSGEIRQAKISPIIVLYEEQQICPEKSLVIENVGNC